MMPDMLNSEMDSNLIRVIIVDDEPLVREGLLYMINWESLECKVVGQAENGIDGIELVKKTSPDIVITDIMMPGVDGLELTGFITQNYPGTQVVILTGYNEFTFAQEAVKSGAADFVLKPTKLEELEKIILSKKEKILKIKREKRQQQEMTHKFAIGIPLLRQKFVSDILYGDRNDLEEIVRNLNFFGMVFCCYAILLIGIERYKEHKEKYGEKEMLHYCFQLEDMLREEAAGHRLDCLVLHDQGLMIGILYSEREADLTLLELNIENIAKNMTRRIRKKLPFAICIGTSPPYNDIRCMCVCLELARKDLGSEVCIGEDDIFVLKKSRIACSVMEYIEKHHQQDLTLKDVADAFHLSQGHVSRLIKKATAKTFVDILTAYRIEKAKHLLKDPKYKIYEVAQKVGFADSRYFSQIFKRAVGLTPSEYKDT